MKIWQKREVVGVTISHFNSHHSTLLQQTQLNYALTHAYSLLDVLTHIHVPFARYQLVASASPSAAAQQTIPSHTLPDWMNIRHRRTDRALPPTVHNAHQSSMHRHLPTIHTLLQLGVNAYTIESIPMSYCIDSLAMRIDTMNRFWLSISHCVPRVLHHRMHDKSWISLIHMNCNYTPSGQLHSDFMQLHHIACVTTAETEDMGNHMDRNGIGKQYHHRCD